MRKKNFFSTILSLLILIALIACGYIFFKDMNGPSIAIVPDTGRVSPHTPLQITLADPSNIRSISVGVRRNNVVTPIFQRHFEEYLPQRTVEVSLKNAGLREGAFELEIKATDASLEMIAEAKRNNRSAKLHFSVQDMFCLPYADKSFDVVIVSNALHIVPQPEKALDEVRRVLKDGGVLIAPTFTHAGNSFSGKVKAFFMKLAGFPLHSRWASEEYLCFLRQNGWTVRKSVVLKASFPLTYAECEKTEG